QKAGVYDQRFYPDTGEPLGQNAGGMGQRRFDPMTGEMMDDDIPMFDPDTGEPLNGGGGRKFAFKKWMIAIPVAAVVVVAGVGLVKGGVLVGKSGKVAVAAAKTFSEAPAIVEDLKSFSVLGEDTYTVTVNVDTDIEGESVEAAVVYSNKSDEMQVSGDVSVAGYANFDFIVGIDSKEVTAQLPFLSDDVFFYNYVEEKDGYLVDILDDQGIDIEVVDEICAAIASGDSQKEKMKAMTKEMKSVLTDTAKSLDFESASEAYYEVDGSDRKCKGYTTTVDEDVVSDLWGGLTDVFDEYYGEDLDAMLEMADADYTLSELYDEVEDAIGYLSDTDLTFYIYKNQLAAIVVEVDHEEIELIFHGGDTRLDDIELAYDGDTVFELTTERSGSEEEYTLEMIDLYGDGGMSTLGRLTYDTKAGDYTLKAYVDDESMSIGGNIQSSSKGVTVTVDSFDFDDYYYGDIDLGLSVAVSQGASIEKLSGDRFDIGNASEDDFYDLVEEYGDTLEDLFY
ncbi:MAG: hypothetical protein LIO96_05930, partial [Lachnospiraceae bacterium]|nr:hypothetical protein [Lachnospiraceae bacterium]